MYVVTPYPNILYALDLTKPGAPMKWTFKPKPSRGRAGRRLLRRGEPRRGLRRRQDLLQHTRRSHGRGGRAHRAGGLERHARRHQPRRDADHGAASSSKGKVLVGNSGGEFGIRGWVTALDADRTGRSPGAPITPGPDKDVLIGPQFKPFYATDRGTDLGVSHAGRPTSGRSAAAACGGGSRTTPNWI